VGGGGALIVNNTAGYPIHANLPAATLQEMQQAPSLPKLHISQAHPSGPPPASGSLGESAFLHWPPPELGTAVGIVNGGLQRMGALGSVSGLAEDNYGGKQGEGGTPGGVSDGTTTAYFHGQF
jgi:hypothetical protein